MKLLLATSNRGKIREIADMLEGMPFETVALGDIPNITPAVETGKTFAANAKIKAKAYFEQTGLLTFAEDSGLEVDWLDGAPGVFSARFAGENCSDDDNVRKLLRLLRGVRAADRTARFVCVVAITDGEKMWTATGKCDGCDSYEDCLGGCSARAFAMTGSFDSPDPHCWVEEEDADDRP